MLITGTIAVGISLYALHSPLATHTFSDHPDVVRGAFGWMMLYLATLTIMLAWYGLLCIRNKRAHRRNRHPVNLFCSWRGLSRRPTAASGASGWTARPAPGRRDLTRQTVGARSQRSARSSTCKTRAAISQTATWGREPLIRLARSAIIRLQPAPMLASSGTAATPPPRRRR